MAFITLTSLVLKFKTVTTILLHDNNRDTRQERLNFFYVIYLQRTLVISIKKKILLIN